MKINKKARAQVFVSGRVQGVFFRENTRQRAQQLGLTGWVKNLPDGRVEAIFEGEKEKVAKIVKWVRKGPFLAKVNNLEIEWQEYKGEFDSFEIRYDF